MKDSARPQQDDSANPVDRPTWRFSGRRGTPVHMREQAPETLPPEIRKAVTQLARERTGEASPAGEARAARSGAGLKLSRAEGGQTPPVAAAPMPVERRADRGSSTPAVPTSHIPALDTTPIVPQATVDVPAPSADVTLPAEPVAAVVEQPEPIATPEPVPATTEPEPVASAPEATEQPAPVAEQPEPVAEKTAQTERAEPVAEPLEPVAEQVELVAEQVEPVAATEAETTPDAVQPKASATSATKDDAATTNSKAAAKREQVSAAERKKRAKARAKARAKQQRERKKASSSGTEKSRRLFARGRDVDAAAAAEVEPMTDEAAAALDITSPVDLGTDAPAPVASDAPTADVPTADVPTAEAPTGDAPTADAPDAPRLETALDSEATAPEPAGDTAPSPSVDDLPDLVPSLDEIDELTPRSFPTIEPSADVDAKESVDSEPAVPSALADADHATLEVTAEHTDSLGDTRDETTVLVPEPSLASESAAQAAWELGRLPFLVHERATPTEDEAATAIAPFAWEMPAPTERTNARADAPATDVAEDPWALPAASASSEEPSSAATPRDTTSRDATSRDTRPEPSPWDEPVPSRSSLRPIDWLPVGSQPTPAPIEPIDLPRSPAPDAIRRLEAPLELPQSTRAHARAGAREGSTPDARTAEARRRIARRRAELDELVHSLSGLGSGRRDA